jgi:hypothetical protein
MNIARYCLITFLFIHLITGVSIAQPDERREVGKKGKEESQIKEVPSKIGLWNLNAYGAFQDSTKLDTLHDYSHIYHPVFKNVISATFLGNYGTAAINNNFFDRKFETNYFFLQSREAYMLFPSTVDYYNTTTPYTRMDYSQSENMSTNSETRFNVVHSQNITPFWNFTFRTRQEKSDGQYTSQESKNNFISLYTSYNKENLNLYGGLIANSIQNDENGGLRADTSIYNGQDADYWNMYLSESQSKLGNTAAFFNGEYSIGKYVQIEDEQREEYVPIVGFLYSFQYDRNKHQFGEDEDDDNDFFENTYYSDDYDTDLIHFNQLTNVVQLKQYENGDKKFSFGKRAFLGTEINRGSMPGYDLDDSTHIRTDIKYSNLYVGGGIYRQTGKFWKWNFDGKFYFAGRNLGQVQLNGDISKPFVFWGDSTASINFSGEIENRVPDYFQEKFYSNHYQWDNNMEMQQSMTLGANFRVPERKLEMGAKYAIINNYVYNDTLGTPTQTNKEILVLSAYFDKDFNYRNLHFRTRLLWQKASNEEYIHLPDLSAFVSTFYQFMWSKVMFTQIGADVRYNTKYYADAYAPSTGLFYLQEETRYGDFPYIDIYANLRLKRTSVFFKWENIGTMFLNGMYMTTAHYPMNRATFRLGVSWAFYD